MWALTAGEAGSEYRSGPPEGVHPLARDECRPVQSLNQRRACEPASFADNRLGDQWS
jgi:hypothetical protein